MGKNEEGMDIEYLKRRFKRKFNIKSEIIKNDLINGLGVFDTYILNGEVVDYSEIETKVIEVADYVQEEYGGYCEYSILDSGYEVIFNFYD